MGLDSPDLSCIHLYVYASPLNVGYVGLFFSSERKQ